MHEILSNEYIEKLISLPKKIVLNDELRDYYQLPCSSLFSTRMPIQSIDGNQIFLLQISQSSKNRLKIDLHFQENARFIQILRVDYHGRHKNPEKANEFVPPYMLYYQGMSIDESHIHLYVQGYDRLEWAIPLSISDFPIKDVNNSESFFAALECFRSRINLLTILRYSGGLFL